MKVLAGAFNQEKALVRAFSVIMQLQSSRRLVLSSHPVLLSWVRNTNGILCCHIKYSLSIQIFTPTKLIEYFCTVALSLESFVLLHSHTICHCFLLWQKMHFTRAENKADEPGYHLKVFIRYISGMFKDLGKARRLDKLSPLEMGTLVWRSIANY